MSSAEMQQMQSFHASESYIICSVSSIKYSMSAAHCIGRYILLSCINHQCLLKTSLFED